MAYLKRTQRDDGTWRNFGAYQGGVTAVCALALLSAGRKSEDDSIQGALDVLADIRPRSTYVTSLQTMVFCLAAPERFARQIAFNVQWLEAAQFKQGPMRGAWGYPVGPRRPVQYAICHFGAL